MKSFVLETKELLLSQGVIAILAIIQIRIVATNLGPEVYGKIGVYWGLIALSFRLLNSRNSDLILINFKNKDKNFLRSSILFEIILGLFSSLIALSLFLISINLEIADTNQIPFYIFIFILSRVSINILEVFKGFYTHSGNLKIYSLVESASSITRFVLVVSFIVYNPQIDSFFFAISINNFMVGIVVIFLLFKNNQSQNEQMSLQEYYSYSKRNFNKIRLDQAVGLIPQHLDVVVIGFFSDFYSAGIYRIAKKLVEPINYIIVAFSPWMLNKISNDQKYNFRKLTIQILFPIAFLLITVYLLFGDKLISFVAGKEFQESIMPMIILLFGYIAYFVTFWTRHYLLLNDLILKHTTGRIINLVVFIISSSVLITQYSFNGIALSISLGIISQKIYEVFVYVKNK
jgi:O-antigen/teichoic acid export membrane protein